MKKSVKLDLRLFDPFFGLRNKSSSKTQTKKTEMQTQSRNLNWFARLQLYTFFHRVVKKYFQNQSFPKAKFKSHNMASKTPNIDRLFHATDLDAACILLGRVLSGAKDTWQLCPVFIGNTDARKALLAVLTQSLALQHPAKDATTLVAHDEGLYYAADAVRKNAAVLVVEENLYSHEWLSMVSKESCMLQMPAHKKARVLWEIPVWLWEIPVLGFIDDTADLYKEKDESIRRRVVPIRVNFSDDISLADVMREIAPFTAKALAAYQSSSFADICKLRDAAL